MTTRLMSNSTARERTIHKDYRVRVIPARIRNHILARVARMALLLE